MMMRRVARSVAVVGLALAMAGCGADKAKPIAPAETSGTSLPEGEVKSRSAGEATQQPVTPPAAGDGTPDAAREGRGVSQVGFERSSYNFSTYHASNVSACVGSDQSGQVCTYTLAAVTEAMAAHLVSEWTSLPAGGSSMTRSWNGVIVNSTGWQNCTPCTLTNVELQAVTRVPGLPQAIMTVNAMRPTGSVVVAFTVTDQNNADAIERLLQAGSNAPTLSSLQVHAGTGQFDFTFTLPSPT